VTQANQIMFVYSAAAGSRSTMHVVVRSAAGTKTIDTGLANLHFRCDYAIAWMAAGDIAFYGCDQYGFQVKVATIARSDPAVPGGKIVLRPFMTVVNDTSPARRSVTLDKMWLVTPR
jgi:hypothetical protein